jgi:hypothetical protein
MSFTNELANFNASVEVTELLMKTLENAARKLAARCISEAASRHGFDADAEIQALGLENLSVTRKQMAKKSASEKKEKKPREPKKSNFPMPFFAENVNADGCQGLAYNRGLFTQCPKNRLDTGDYCKGCQTEADKNASGCPDCGNVSARLATGLYEFKDPKGRSPISYVKLIKKLNLTLEQVSEETGKTGKTIPEEHLVVVEKKFARGRPKKVNAVETDDLSVVSDLFYKLSVEKKQDKEDSTFQTCLEGVDAVEVSDLFSKIGEVLEEEVLEEEVLEEEVLESPVKTKKPKLSEDEKAALEAEKAQKKSALEAEKAEKEAKKLALEAEKAEKKAALEAEKEAKKLALEAEKAEKKAALEKEKAEKKAALEAEKAQKKEAEKAERQAKRDAEKTQKKEKKVDEKEKVDEPVTEKEKVDEPQPAKVKVTRIQISGKSYLKTTNNLLYNPETKEEVGIWDPDTKTIKPLPEEEDEEEQEEEYDSN